MRFFQGFSIGHRLGMGGEEWYSSEVSRNRAVVTRGDAVGEGALARNHIFLIDLFIGKRFNFTERYKTLIFTTSGPTILAKHVQLTFLTYRTLHFVQGLAAAPLLTTFFDLRRPHVSNNTDYEIGQPNPPTVCLNNFLKSEIFDSS